MINHRKQAVLWSVVLLLVPGIIIGAWFGGVFASTLETRVLSSFFAVFEFFVAVSLLLKKQPAQHQTRIKTSVATVGGSIIGFISTIVGVAGGTMTVPFLHWFNISMHKAVATSALYALAIIASSSFIFAPLGAKLTHTVSEKTLRLSFSFILFMLSITMFLS